MAAALPSSSYNGKTIPLIIIVRSYMNDGYCYIGMELNEHRFYRPIYRMEPEQCKWNKKYFLRVGCVYQFKLVEPQVLTTLPHSMEDVLVEESMPKCLGRLKNSLFDVLLPKACDTVASVFGGLEFSSYFPGFNEGTRCPSFGVLKCRKNRFSIHKVLGFNDEVKPRLFIEEYALPITFCWDKIEDDDDDDDDDDTAQNRCGNDKEALILLGLGRPFDKYGEFDPPRCYALALGILYKPDD